VHLEVAMPTVPPAIPNLGSKPSRPRRSGLPLAAVIAAVAMSVIAFVNLHRAPMPEEVVLASMERLFASDAGLTR
jgi:hypothetical protein